MAPLRRACLAASLALLALLLLAAPRPASALPRWSWDTMQTFFHCANESGAWTDAAAARIARGAFDA